MEAGLPLGIAAGVEYAESVMTGGNFTFVSDGVVEAANPKGELFGFDRTRDISPNPRTRSLIPPAPGARTTTSPWSP